MERTDERKSPCVLQDFVPFGAAAQKVDTQAKNKAPRTPAAPSPRVTRQQKKQSSTPLTDGRTKPLLELRVRN